MNITQVGVPYLWLHHVARILVDGLRRRGGSSIMKADGTEDITTRMMTRMTKLIDTNSNSLYLIIIIYC